MSEKFKNVALTKRGAGLPGSQQMADPFATREYSEETQRYIDEKIASIVDERYNHVVSLLNDKRDMLDRISSLVLEKEVIEESEFAALTEESRSEKAIAGAMPVDAAVSSSGTTESPALPASNS
jgi:cell division protease FtsH